MGTNKRTITSDVIRDGRSKKYRVRLRVNRKNITKHFYTRKEADDMKDTLYKMFAMMGFNEELEAGEVGSNGRTAMYKGHSEESQIIHLYNKINSLVYSDKMPEEFNSYEYRKYLGEPHKSMWMKYRDTIATSRKVDGKTLWKLNPLPLEEDTPSEVAEVAKVPKDAGDSKW